MACIWISHCSLILLLRMLSSMLLLLSRDGSVVTNHKLSSTPMWSPRVGFRWNIEKEHNMILRGGAGIFTGSIPFVWLSNNFTILVSRLLYIMYMVLLVLRRVSRIQVNSVTL